MIASRAARSAAAVTARRTAWIVSESVFPQPWLSVSASTIRRVTSYFISRSQSRIARRCVFCCARLVQETMLERTPTRALRVVVCEDDRMIDHCALQRYFVVIHNKLRNQTTSIPLIVVGEALMSSIVNSSDCQESCSRADGYNEGGRVGSAVQNTLLEIASASCELLSPGPRNREPCGCGASSSTIGLMTISDNALDRTKWHPTCLGTTNASVGCVNGWEAIIAR